MSQWSVGAKRPMHQLNANIQLLSRKTRSDIYHPFSDPMPLNNFTVLAAAR